MRMVKTTYKEAAMRIVAVLGLLAILLLGAWGIIQVAFFISSLFNNAGGAISTSRETRETITVSLPSSATAGNPITVSWKHSGGSGAYAYTVSYSCSDGLSFKAPVPTGAKQSAPCDTPFNYTQATKSLALTPVYSGSTDAKTTITVTATKLATGAMAASATSDLSVLATKRAAVKTTAPTKTSGTSSKGTYVAGARSYTNLYGYPDLAVTITSAYSQGGRATLQFVVQNIGTNVTPANWSFSAYLPISGGYSYPSGPQQALYPGDKIVYSMGFSDIGSGYSYGTCNQYGPCAVPGYSGGYQPSYNQTGYNPYGCSGYTTYGYAYGTNCPSYPGYGQNKAVTVTVDQYNQVADLNRYNNTATASYISY